MAQAKLTDQDVQAINAKIQADPEWTRLYQAYLLAVKNAKPGANGVLVGEGPEVEALHAYMDQHGLPRSLAEQYHVELDPQGNLTINHAVKNFVKTAAISAGIALGGAAALGSFPVAGATAGTSAGSAAGQSAATAATAGGPALWETIARTAAPVATALVGAKIAANANDKAAQLEADAADKAAQVQKDIYQQNRTDTAGYRNLGNSSLSALANLTGQPNPITTPTIPSAAAVGPTLASLANPQAPTSQTPVAPPMAAPMVTLRAPNGKVAQIPQDQANHYIQLGAQVIG